MERTFYNRQGKPIAYSENGVDVYRFDGTPVAYLDGESLFSYSGKHVGWLQDEWVIDRHGGNVLFTDLASGAPLRPVKSLKPLKGLKRLRPIKGVRQHAPLRPLRRLSWADRNDGFSMN
jgi:hypothetical protein